MKYLFGALSALMILTFVACGDSNAQNQVENSDVISIRVSNEEFTKILDENSPTLIDIRTPEEYAEGTIRNAD